MEKFKKHPIKKWEVSIIELEDSLGKNIKWLVVYQNLV